jgi:hypothetical protein
MVASLAIDSNVVNVWRHAMPAPNATAECNDEYEHSSLPLQITVRSHRKQPPELIPNNVTVVSRNPLLALLAVGSKAHDKFALSGRF